MSTECLMPPTLRRPNALIQLFSWNKRVRLSKLIGSSSSFTCQNELIVLDTPEWKYKNNMKAKKEDVKCSESESVQSTSGADTNVAMRDLSRSFDAAEKESRESLGFLVHNTNLYMVRSSLVYLQQHPNPPISDYYHTKLREDVFGNVSLSFLKNIYVKRCKLLSYYRRLGCYPNEGGKRVDTCLACSKKNGKYDCQKNIAFILCLLQVSLSFDV